MSTFNVRLLAILRDIFPDYPLSSPWGDEEYEFVVGEVCDNLRKEVHNADSEEEKAYFNNLVKGYSNGDDIIKWIGKDRKDWLVYLKNTHIL